MGMNTPDNISDSKKITLLMRDGRLCLTLAEGENTCYAPHGKARRPKLAASIDDLGAPLCIDFLSGPMNYRLHACLHNRGELIGRAVGISKAGRPLTVIDATAGLGRDACILAGLGCRVHMLERSPIVVALLKDALMRARRDSAEFSKLKLTVTQKDAIVYFKTLSFHDYPDVIYMDPMYPKRRTSALVKREMRYLQHIVGNDDDAERLLTVSQQRARRRVVIKRPRLAPVLGDRNPDLQFIGKTSRFDVYLVSSNVGQ